MACPPGFFPCGNGLCCRARRTAFISGKHSFDAIPAKKKEARLKKSQKPPTPEMLKMRKLLVQKGDFDELDKAWLKNNNERSARQKGSTTFLLDSTNIFLSTEVLVKASNADGDKKVCHYFIIPISFHTFQYYLKAVGTISEHGWHEREKRPTGDETHGDSRIREEVKVER